MSYSSEVLADSPILYWRLSSTVGTESDLGSGGHTATYNGTPTRGVAGLIPSDSDGAVSLPGGSSTWVETPNVTDLRFTSGPWAVVAWIEPSVYSGYQVIVGCGAGGGLGYRFGLVGDELRITIPSVTDIVSTSVNLTGRHHVAAVFRADADVDFYKDGAFIETVVNASVPTSNTTANFHVGITNSATEAFTGKIDEVAVYSSGISAARILAHYNAAQIVASTVIKNIGLKL